jgi:hypothetical protein
LHSPSVRPAAGLVIADLLEHGRGLDLTERAVAGSEVGLPPRDAAGTVIAVVRGDEVLAPTDSRVAQLSLTDRLILISSRDRPTTQPPVPGVGL